MEYYVKIKHKEFIHNIATQINGRPQVIRFCLPNEMLTWLMENIGLPSVKWKVENTLHASDNTLGGIMYLDDPAEGITFLFKNETDAIAFKLRWG